MKKRFSTVAACLLAVVIAVCALIAMPASAQEQKLPYVVAADATQADVLEAWATGSYSNIQLSNDLELTLSGETLVVDLAGNDLSVSGSGKVSAFDSANDTYDHTVCGTLTLGGSVTCDATCVAPNGNTYIAWGDSSRVSLHRVNMKITAASLRMSCAGMYYKAIYECDRFMAEKVQSYGVAVSLVDMPGKNFATAADDLYTALDGADFVSGAVVNSGIVANIMGADWNGEENLANANKKIYARIYVDFGNGPVMPSQGVACSLMDMMNMADGKYSGYTDTVRGQLDDFYNQWKTRDVAWSFVNIGTSTRTIDNSDLAFDADTTNAYCPVCEKKVTWTALSDETNITLAKDMHYYLAEDLEYTGTASEFIASNGTGGVVSCLHLNGHNITATATTAIYGGGGVLNVMGNGVVSGYSTNDDEGAAIYTNNRNAKNGINLYGGTYKRTADAPTKVPVISFGPNGRHISIYADATVDGGTTLAMKFQGESSRQKEGYVNLFGCTVNGNLSVSAFNTYVTNVQIVDAAINGTFTIPEGQNVTMSGKVSIAKLVVPAGLKFATKGLEEGSDIGVDATGIFTEQSGNIADYVEYFTPVDSHNKISVKDYALRCSKDYTSDLKFAEGTTDAYCPVCDKTVTWTPLTQTLADEATGESYAITMEAGSHYYLAENVTYTGTATYTFLRAGSAQGDVACLHLNGKDLTTTNRGVFYSSSGVLNVMGTGTVTGHNKSASYGAVVHSNNKNVTASMNFYSGTYTTDNALATGYVVRFGSAGGRIYFYEDAVVDGGDTGKAFYLTELDSTTNDSVLSIQGATVHGDISANGTAAPAVCNYAITLDNAVLNGTLDGNGTNKINLARCVKIGLLDIEEGSMVTLDSLEPGTAVTVQNVGPFAYENEEADSYVSYFKAAWINDKIINKDNVLTYKTNYEMNLQLDGNDQAWCPVCMAYATWTPLELNAETGRLTLSGGHVYLASDIDADYEGTGSSPGLLSTGTTATTCLHLNGHSITANKAQAIFGSEAGLNVMGSGVVSGYGTGSSKGAVIHCNNKNASHGIRLYSGTYQQLRSTKGVLSLGLGGVYKIYEDAVIGEPNSTDLAIDIGTATSRAAELYIYDATINGNVNVPGASATFASIVAADNATINGTFTVAGTNEIVLSGLTKIDKLEIAGGSTVSFANMLPGSAITVSAEGVFTTAMADADDWLQYISTDVTGDWVIVRDKCFYQGVKTEVTNAEQADIDALLAAYADRVVKYGEMHNHTGAGPQADGWYTLARWKTEMEKMGMSFATIVDHKQVAHMYHDDWITEPTADSDIVFVGGSEPATHVTDLGLSSDKNDFHYNMLVNDPEKLLEIITNTGKFTIKEFANYADFSGNSYNDTNNKAMLYDPTEYSADPDGVLQIWNYPSFKRAEFESLVDAIYDAGGLLVHVHPKYSSYMVSDNPLDYFYGGDAGTGEGTAMGIEIHTSSSSNHSPSRSANEKAYQMWVDLLELGKKAYAAYGNDNHRLPTAHALTTMYASSLADSDEYLGYMHNGDYTPGWVGIRMQIGDASMGGETDFTGQRLVFSIGDMYYNESTASYDTFDPSYNADHKYIVQLYDDGGLLMESEVDPGQMNYFAIDADASAKYYRVVVWDMTQGYRCGVGNPIWNTNVTE